MGNILQALVKYRDKKKNLITYKELEEFPENVSVQIYPNKIGDIECTKLRSTNDDLSFKVHMRKGAKWTIHEHDCLETILVYEGTLNDTVNDFKITRMNPATVHPYTLHSMEALEDTIFYVEFKNPYH